jgi:DNA adenine methylase
MDSPLRWPGGKSRLAAMIVGLLPEHDCYVEPFCGGAWVFFAKPRAASKAEVLNDLDGELVNLYRVLQVRGRRLVASVGRLPYSRAVYERLFDSRPRSAFARARRFLYINRVGFGGRTKHKSFSIHPDRRKKVLPEWLCADSESLIHRLEGVVFESMNAMKLIPLYDRPTTIFFLDPPYFNTKGLYPFDMDRSAHEALASMLRGIRGRFLLTLDDCSEARRLYRRFSVRPLRGIYTMSTQGASLARELLIANFQLPRRLLIQGRYRGASPAWVSGPPGLRRPITGPIKPPHGPCKAGRPGLDTVCPASFDRHDRPPSRWATNRHRC